MKYIFIIILYILITILYVFACVIVFLWNFNLDWLKDYKDVIKDTKNSNWF